jgi:hypothetical protein
LHAPIGVGVVGNVAIHIVHHTHPTPRTRAIRRADGISRGRVNRLLD